MSSRVDSPRRGMSVCDPMNHGVRRLLGVGLALVAHACTETGASADAAPTPVVDVGPACARQCAAIRRQCGSAPDACEAACVCREAARPSCRAAQARYIECATNAVFLCPSGEPAVFCRIERDDYAACRAGTAATPGAACADGDADVGADATTDATDVPAVDVPVVDTAPGPVLSDYRLGTVQSAATTSVNGSSVYVVEFVEGGHGTCTLQTIGPWRVERCTDIRGRVLRSAGAITFGAGGYVDTPNDDGMGYVLRYDDTRRTAGDSVRIAAAGAAVPAFDATLTYPTPLSGLRISPEPNASTVVEVLAGEPLSLTWTAGAGTVRVRIVQIVRESSPARQVWIEGFVDRAAGGVVVPDAVLDGLHRAEATTILSVAAASFTALTVDAWPVQVSVLEQLQNTPLNVTRR